MADNDITSRQILLGQKLLEKLTIASKTDIAGGEECSICNKAYFTGPFREMPMKAPCGHIFGGNCIQLWISSAKKPQSCPVCRTRVLDETTWERQMAWHCYNSLSKLTTRQPISGPALRGDGEQWALKAESLWQQFCKDLVHSLEDIHDQANWALRDQVVVRRIVGLATVARFARERKDANSDMFGYSFNESLPSYPESYRNLCTHLDAVDSHDELFLTPGEDYFVWLAHQHRKIDVCYKRYVESMKQSMKPRDA